jgi:hypothetical protein
MVVDEMAKFVIKCAKDGRGHSGDYAYRRYLQTPKGERPDHTKRPEHLHWRT